MKSCPCDPRPGHSTLPDPPKPVRTRTSGRRAGRSPDLLAALLATALPVSAGSDGGQWRVTTGVEYSTGDYGGSKSIEEWYVP